MAPHFHGPIRTCAVAAFLLAGCDSDAPHEQVDYGHVVAFDTASVRVIGPADTVPLRVELAVSPDQRTMGLMERRELADAAGMLFVYESMQPADAGFWMYRTRIPLDIAYIDSTGVIRSIRSMAPCEASLPQGCPTYAPGVRYQYALEVNEGFFARHAITIGDSVTVGDALPAGRLR